MNNLFMVDIETYLKVIDLAYKHDKKPGESMIEEFTEMMKLYPEKFRYLGTTDMDKDLLLGNIREETKLKILDLTQEKNE